MKYQSNYCIIGRECVGDYCLHHVKPRGSGGKDNKSNLMSLCVKHHSEVHQIGLNRFAERYYQVRHWLNDFGWSFNQFLGKWKR